MKIGGGGGGVKKRFRLFVWRNMDFLWGREGLKLISGSARTVKNGTSRALLFWMIGTAGFQNGFPIGL